jgi:hypothetical protein
VTTAIADSGDVHEGQLDAPKGIELPDRPRPPVRIYPFAGDLREWPREESNLRTQIRSLPLYPLSYGARRDRSQCSPAVGYALAGAWRSRSAASPCRSSRLRSASALISAPKRIASAESQSQVSMTMTAASEPQALLYEPNMLT